jgi:hypothetical protein
MQIKIKKTGLRREWDSTNYVVFQFTYNNQTKYPSDFGLLRISFHDTDNANMQFNYDSKKVNLFQERDNLILNFFLPPARYPQSLTPKTDEKYPQPLANEPNSLLYQEHLYTRIPSLTNGYDHQVRPV